MSIREEMLAYFQEPHIHAKIIQYVHKHNLQIEQLDESALVRMMEDLQLLDDIQKRVAQEQAVEISNVNTLNLTLTVHKGRKFKPFLELPKSSTFHFLLSGFDQKDKSCSYKTAQNFSLAQKMSLKVKTSFLKADNNQNLQLILVVVLEGGQKILYSIKLIQWRFILVYGSVSIDLQLAPYHHDGLTLLPSVGILSITLAISPFPKHFFIQELKLTRQLQLQQKTKQSANNKFHNYANSYWSEIKNLHRALQNRRIPIYAQTEDKIYVALPKMIKPIYGIRGIDSPHHALRFCSLISFTQPQLNKQNFMRRFSTLLAGAEGSVEDHCHLLCSLLLGMGLKTYVCVGTTAKGQHSWVMSQVADSVTFWECTKGIKLDYFSTKALTFYKTIDAVYNHHQYYANIQLDDSISGTKFNFKDQNLWKKMEETFLDELPSFNKQFSPSFPTLNPYSIEQQLQSSLISLIKEYRAKLKASFSYDQILSSLLATALANYQNQRVTGTTFCEEEFQTAIKGYIPPKHTFKAFPIQLTTYDANQVMAQILQQPKSKQILNAKGESIFFGVRTKLVVFPDNIFALWLSLAVRYFKLD